MDIRFACLHCEQHIAIDEAGVGLQIECPGCRSQVIVPELAPVAPVSPIQTRIRRAASQPAAAPAAPPPLPPAPVGGDRYRCNNPACGAIL
jgi:DNA-directed RNA polymerase subunit RPC12/RpoP